MRALVAVDGSTFAESALEAMGQMARETGMDLVLTTVVNPDDVRETFAPADYVNVPVPVGTSGGRVLSEVARPAVRTAEDRTQALERIRTDAEEYLDRLVAAHLLGVPTVTRIEMSADTAEAIVAAARDSGARLIAVGTHGRSGMGRVLMGSVAEAVVRIAGMPVLVVHESESAAMR